MKLIKSIIVYAAVFTMANAVANAVANDGSVSQNKATEAHSNDKCGTIVLYNKPPSTANVHYASINSINGQAVSEKARSFTLSEGKHIIKVIEHIDEDRLAKRRDQAQNFHVIEFDVKADKKYSLGAKYIRKNRSKITTGEYWTPEVWKTSSVKCNV